MTPANPSPSAITNQMNTPTSSMTAGVMASMEERRPSAATVTQSQGQSQAQPQSQQQQQQQQSTQGLSSLVSTVLKTTGNEPVPRVGPSTTIVGDMLYVFGGRILSRSQPQLTSDMYVLNLLTRVWTKLETKGNILPRYFHSICALGDTKLVCFGGMSPANGGQTPLSPTSMANADNDVMVVMSDIHIFDIKTLTWTEVQTVRSPEGRYAHCAAIIPSSATYAEGVPNSGTTANGLGLDAYGGAEMIVVGGQDSKNHYIEEIHVFNLRSLQWTSENSFKRSCGAYRSVIAPLGRSFPADKIGSGKAAQDPVSVSAVNGDSTHTDTRSQNAMLIYSNYNFLDVRLELQVRLGDGTLTEKKMNGQQSPPGLRFPNGGVLDNHFVVSGTFLTSNKQEYALWALDLRTLEWNRIEAGTIFSSGSWNRGILWPRRNAFMVLGNQKRSLVEDYNHRRINFAHFCMVELEAWGFYENPRHSSHPGLHKCFSPQAQDLGRAVLQMREMADMELVAVGGEKIPINSRVLARRWGPYFLELLNGTHPTPAAQQQQNQTRAVSMATITPQNFNAVASSALTTPPTTAQFSPLERPRTLFLPHTHQTLQTLVHYLYTGCLPEPFHPQSSPQILCSLLQLARPYRIEGLLEAVVERLHQVLDGKNAAAVFNAAAMAAGSGRGVWTVAKEVGLQVEEKEGDDEEEGSRVIGLQKRGLRGLMEGRRMRERGRSMGSSASVMGGQVRSEGGAGGAGMQGTFGGS